VIVIVLLVMLQSRYPMMHFYCLMARAAMSY